MSKRLQVVVSDEEYRAITRVAAQRGVPVAEVVRDSLRRTLPGDEAPDPNMRIALVLGFARFAGPTGDIDRILTEVEKGREAT
jgi:hypothetical protein